LRELGAGHITRRRGVRRCLALGDLRLVRLLAVENGSDIGDRSRRRHEGGANFKRCVRCRCGRILWRRRRRHARGLFLLGRQNAGAHVYRAASLPRLFQFRADRLARIADLAADAGAQFLHVRLPAHFDELLVAGGARRLRQRDYERYADECSTGQRDGNAAQSTAAHLHATQFLAARQ
jgi:hypothetical protein